MQTPHRTPAPLLAMMAAIAIGSLTGALAGCGAEQRAEKAQQKAAVEAQDVAMVERMNEAPFRAVTPEPIGPRAMRRYGLSLRSNCAFHPGFDGMAAPLFVARADEGYMRVKRELVRLAAKTDAAELPGGARTTYVGLDSWVELVRQPDSVTGSTSSDARFPARMVIHDAQERVAFLSEGEVRCTEVPGLS